MLDSGIYEDHSQSLRKRLKAVQNKRLAQIERDNETAKSKHNLAKAKRLALSIVMIAASILVVAIVIYWIMCLFWPSYLPDDPQPVVKTSEIKCSCDCGKGNPLPNTEVVTTTITELPEFVPTEIPEHIIPSESPEGSESCEFITNGDDVDMVCKDGSVTPIKDILETTDKGSMFK